MKTNLLLIVTGLCISVSAQTGIPFNPGVTTNAINKINIGSSTNAEAEIFGGRTLIYADPVINSISFVFQGDIYAGDSSDYLYYSKSTDGGLTFTSHIGPIYSATGGLAGPNHSSVYPQCLIYNPVGNTDTNNAYITYFAASAAGSVNTLGGYVTGSASLGGGSPTQTEFISQHAGRPYDFCLLQGGTVGFGIDASHASTTPWLYDDNLLLYKGVWNGSDFTYVEQYVSAPVAVNGNGTPATLPRTKIAFGPDGLTGYMAIMGHLDWSLVSDSNYSPIIFKTTDGGNTWSSLGTIILDNCDNVLGNGLSEYTSGYDMDLAVDVNGECHLFFAVALSSNNFFLAISSGAWGLFDFYSSPSGWKTEIIAHPRTFGGLFTDSLVTVNEGNRPQIARTLAGDKLFFLFFDTDINIYGSANGNKNPDMWCAAYDVNTCNWVEAYNVTAGSNVSGQCWFGNVAPYVLGTTGTYTIPLSTHELAGAGPSSRTTHYYVQGLEITDAQFTTPCSPVSISLATVLPGITQAAASFKVTQNLPNPFNEISSFTITTKTGGDFTLEISDVSGRVVKTETYQSLLPGEHRIQLEASNLSTGTFYYTVKYKNEKITNKMVVN